MIKPPFSRGYLLFQWISEPRQNSEKKRQWKLADFSAFVMLNRYAFTNVIRKTLIINTTVREGFEPSVAFWATAL